MLNLYTIQVVPFWLIFSYLETHSLFLCQNKDIKTPLLFSYLKDRLISFGMIFYRQDQNYINKMFVQGTSYHDELYSSIWEETSVNLFSLIIIWNAISEGCCSIAKNDHLHTNQCFIRKKDLVIKCHLMEHSVCAGAVLMKL